MRLLAEIKELLGKIGSLDEELDEYITSTTQHQQKIDEFETIVDINKIEEKDKMTFLKLKEEVNSAVVKGLNAKKQLQNLNSQTVVLQGGIEKTNILQFLESFFAVAFDVLFGTFSSLASLVKELTTVALVQLKNNKYTILKNLYNVGINAVGIGKLNDARALWNISSFNGTKDYVLENSKVYEKISDLHNNKLETKIRTKLNSQLKITEARGLVFHHESSLSQNIIKSDVFKNYIGCNKDLLSEKRILGDTSLYFKYSDDFNLFNALGHVELTDIKLDGEKNLIAKIIDTYDFNAGDKNPVVQGARILQEEGLIKNYYEIIVIKVPFEVWQKF